MVIGYGGRVLVVLEHLLVIGMSGFSVIGRSGSGVTARKVVIPLQMKGSDGAGARLSSSGIKSPQPFFVKASFGGRGVASAAAWLAGGDVVFCLGSGGREVARVGRGEGGGVVLELCGCGEDAAGGGGGGRRWFTFGLDGVVAGSSESFRLECRGQAAAFGFVAELVAGEVSLIDERLKAREPPSYVRRLFNFGVKAAGGGHAGSRWLESRSAAASSRKAASPRAVAGFAGKDREDSDVDVCGESSEERYGDGCNGLDFGLELPLCGLDGMASAGSPPAVQLDGVGVDLSLYGLGGGGSGGDGLFDSLDMSVLGDLPAASDSLFEEAMAASANDDAGITSVERRRLDICHCEAVAGITSVERRGLDVCHGEAVAGITSVERRRLDVCHGEAVAGITSVERRRLDICVGEAVAGITSVERRGLDVCHGEAVAGIFSVERRGLDVCVGEAVAGIISVERRGLDVCHGEAVVGIISVERRGLDVCVGEVDVFGAKRSDCPVQCDRPARKQRKVE